jgi:hypothetical protein
MAGAGKVCVNFKNGKPSYVAVYDSAGPFRAATDISAVFDEGNELSWDWNIRSKSTTTIKLRLKGKGKHSHILVKGSKKKRRKRILDDPNDPQSGTLVITITGPGAQDVEVQNAQYVEDSPPQ